MNSDDIKRDNQSLIQQGDVTKEEQYTKNEDSVNTEPCLTMNHRNRSRPKLIPQNTIPDRHFTWEQFCSRITCHGIMDLYTAKSAVARIFWSMLIITTASMFALQFYKQCVEFYTDPILTTMSFVPKRSMPFPKVYVCPFSFVDWPRLTKHDQSAVVKNRFAKIQKIFHNTSGSVLHQHQSRWKEMIGIGSNLQSIYKKTVPEKIPELLDEFLQFIAMDTDDFIEECQFKGQSLSCNSITKRITDKEFGLCYLVDINSRNDSQNTHQTNPAIGLTLLLDINQEKFPTGEGLLPLVAGVNVRIDYEIDIGGYGGIMVHPGTHTQLALRMQELRLISIYHSTTPQVCVDNEKDVQVFPHRDDCHTHALKILNTTYTDKTCEMDRVQQNVFDKCNCLFPVDRSHLQQWVYEENGNRTANESDLFCNETRIEQCVNKAMTHFNLSCSEDCHRACHQREIVASASQAAFPGI